MLHQVQTFTADFRRRLIELNSAALAGTDPPSHLLGESLYELSRALEEFWTLERALREQMEGLEALKRQVETERSRYREAFYRAPIPYLTTDGRGTIREANDAAGELLGVVPAQLAGQPLVRLVAPEDHELYRDRLTELGESALWSSWGMRMQPRSRALVSVTVTVAPEHDLGGGNTGLRWVLLSPAGTLPS